MQPINRTTTLLALAISLLPSGCPDPDPEPITTDSESSGTTAAESLDGTSTTTGDTSSTTGDTTSTGDTTTSTTEDTTTGGELPAAPVLALGFSPVKQLDFTWAAVDGADHYELLESPAPGEPFAGLAGDLIGEAISITTPLHLRYQASYILRACNEAGCTDSAQVDVMGSLAEAVGYVKASNTDAIEYFGYGLALSGDGNTLAVGAFAEDSSATGIDGDQTDDSASFAGAVYVFVRGDTGTWAQQAYVKASNTGAGDWFGYSVALSSNGDILAVGAPAEDSDATGIDGDQGSDATDDAGAAYVFVRDPMDDQWSQQAYVKASNTDVGDWFGESLALSGDGSTLAVGARLEDGSATGIGGDQADESATNAGAVYVFVRDAMDDQWSQQAYVKASNAGADDIFGFDVALSEDGNTLAVGALLEDSGAIGLGGSQADDSAVESGAVYVFARDAMGGQWSQQAYVKASNTGPYDGFGYSVGLSGDGNTLAVGAFYEDSDATGVDGDQASDFAGDSGAVYVFVRDGMDAWTQQAYVKASNTGSGDYFGWSTTLSADGSTLAVSAPSEDGDAVGLGGIEVDDTAADSGAGYVFVRSAMGEWSQQAYVKASNTGPGDELGYGVVLSADAQTLAIGAYGEDGIANGIGGDQADDSAPGSGAVYLY